jgi:hypothetical protein
MVTTLSTIMQMTITNSTYTIYIDILIYTDICVCVYMYTHTYKHTHGAVFSRYAQSVMHTGKKLIHTAKLVESQSRTSAGALCISTLGLKQGIRSCAVTFLELKPYILRVQHVYISYPCTRPWVVRRRGFHII